MKPREVSTGQFSQVKHRRMNATIESETGASKTSQDGTIHGINARKWHQQHTQIDSQEGNQRRSCVGTPKHRLTATCAPNQLQRTLSRPRNRHLAFLRARPTREVRREQRDAHKTPFNSPSTMDVSTSPAQWRAKQVHTTQLKPQTRRRQRQWVQDKTLTNRASAANSPHSMETDNRHSEYQCRRAQQGQPFLRDSRNAAALTYQGCRGRSRTTQTWRPIAGGTTPQIHVTTLEPSLEPSLSPRHR